MRPAYSVLDPVALDEIELLTAHVEPPDAIARPHTYDQDPRGTLGLLADAERHVLAGLGQLG